MADDETSSESIDISFDFEERSEDTLAGDESRAVLPDGTVLDLTPTQQARIDLLFEGLDSKNYYEILEVKRDTPLKGIKRAYYRLSKEFHPDKFFRRSLGPYKPKLETIFAAINEAYRVLSDDAARDDYDAEVFAEDRKGAGHVPMATHEVNFVGTSRRSRAVRGSQVRQKKKKGELPGFLKQKRDELMKRLKKARKAFLLGKQHYDNHEYKEAAERFQLAMLLDPKHKEAPEMYRRSLSAARDAKAEAFWRQGREAMDREQYQDAARFFKQSVDCQPTRGKYYHSFGMIIWEHTMRQRTAIELLRTAVEKEPRNVEYILELARAYETVGMPSNALKAFERVLEIESGNAEAKKGVKRLR